MATVADTAFLVAAFRAEESMRPNALFVDPLAARLAGEAGRAMRDKVGARGDLVGWSVVMRTVIIDRFIAEAIQQGTQVVLNLGAGLDARPYRMALPQSLVWIELDQDSVIAHKRASLANEVPRCRLERVVLDLVDTAARRTSFSRSLSGDAPALVLAEGLVPYLDEDAVAGVLDDLRNQKSVQKLVVDYIAPAVVHARNARGTDGADSVPLRFAPADWAGFFLSHGWRVKEMRDLVDEGLRCGRPSVRDMPRGAFAYALLERA